MNSMANFNQEERTKIKDLSLATHEQIFDFSYPLSTHVNKADFECDILDYFIMRRIGYETFTAFQIALKVKLRAIMPMYNKMFDALDGWNIFTDGEVITRGINESGTTQAISNGSSTMDNRYSNTPQNKLTQVQDGTYMSEYTYNQGTNNITSSGNDARITNETVTKQPSDKIKIYKEFKENKEAIMQMIYNDLESLFYGLVR